MANAVPSGSSLTKMAGLSVAVIRLPPISIPVSALGTISQSAVRPSNGVIFTYSPPAGATPGVMGTDLAAIDLAHYLRDQRITATSTAFIFTKTGEVIALPDAGRITKAIHADGQMLVMPPKIGYLNDPIIAGLVAAYEDGRMAGTRIYDVAGRTYVGRVVEIPPRYGRDQLLAIMVPIDEIEKPITEIRNQTLFYSIGFLVFALPLYVTLVVAWIDRRLEARAQTRDDD